MVPEERGCCHRPAPAPSPQRCDLSLFILAIFSLFSEPALKTLTQASLPSTSEDVLAVRSARFGSLSAQRCNEPVCFSQTALHPALETWPSAAGDPPSSLTASCAAAFWRGRHGCGGWMDVPGFCLSRDFLQTYCRQRHAVKDSVMIILQALYNRITSALYVGYYCALLSAVSKK